MERIAVLRARMRMRSVGCTLKEVQSKCHVRAALVLAVGPFHTEAGALFPLEPPTVTSDEVLVVLGHEASYRVVNESKTMLEVIHSTVLRGARRTESKLIERDTSRQVPSTCLHFH